MSQKMMKAVQLLGKEKIRLTEVSKPIIDDTELLIKVKAASICGTDVRMFKNGYVNVDEEHPLILGHEISGVIEEVGNLVNGYEKGMRVAVAPNMGCGICDQCVSGNTHLCAEYEAFGINLPGGFAEYLKVPEKAIRQGNVTLLQDEISFEEAALIEPFSCVFNGQEISGVNAGDTVLIVGAGPIGIMHAMLALNRGAGKVLMNDLQIDRLNTAKELVPELTIVTSDNLQEKIMFETGGKGVDLCIVAAPAPKVQEESFNYMGMNGRLLFFGGLPKEKENVPLNTNLLHYKQLRVYGCTRASLNGYRLSEKLIASGRIPLNQLITKLYPIDSFMEALKNAEQAVGMKNVIVF
ncbi:L-iditol 2-dehydrogenase [Enterococcus sp. PF1-24]|uniref:zinc-dependent dehydrogenase n=1 Tax=unclassified Enterococcus TaxID=2608891 RepID=UPI002473F443|nr:MULTISPECIES: zinc-dependent dehydrogenase [unclassified Enterococcus]MDH6364007.1 L-iditol 2-dehydrogenase [Enterococcus sp. PFB1-1]MDH6401108.1 L-iditol 2-dehydrogenase [Enterococcus sp. PF1-24]